jgi:hypothetical protein
MAGRLSTTSLADGKRTGKQIFGELELADQRKLALAEPGGFRALGLRTHLDVTILQELGQGKQNSRMQK